MRRHFIAILIVLFAAYAFINNKNKLSIKTSVTDSPAYKFVEEAKSYIEILSKDPSSTSLKGKTNPILQNQTALEGNSLKTPPKKLPSSPVPSGRSKTKNKVSEFNSKLANIAYNLVHTEKGQELLEKILFNPPVYDEKKNNKEPNPYHNNSTIDVIHGDGPPVECGDIVKVHYITRLVSGQEIENTYKSGQPVIFRIGDQKVIKGLEYAVIGMQKEGVRRLIVPPKMAYNDKKLSKGAIAGNEFVTIDVGLLDITPLIEDWRDKIRIFENEDFKSLPILCSNPVFFNYTVSTSGEKVIYKSTNKVSFILGSSAVPAAINKAFSNVRRYAKRSIIFPSSLIYNKEINFLPKNFKFPAKEMIILDVEVTN